MNYYQDKAVICPFYRKENCTKIMCEGAVANSSTQLSFETEAQKRRHKQRFCLKFCYLECPLAEGINKKYI